MISRLVFALGVVCCVARLAPAQTPPPDPAKPMPDPKVTAKLNATQLRDLGNKLFDDKNYLGALAVFKEAYARFPSVKILLNIGVTLNRLERFADAANAFTRYIDSPDADASMKPDLVNAIADIDKSVGVLDLSVLPGDAQVQVNDGQWVAATVYKAYRVPAGNYEVHAKKDGFQPHTTSGAVAAGVHQAVSITLAAIPEKTKEIIKIVPGGVEGSVQPEGPRSQVGAIAIEHLDVLNSGAATIIGVTFDVFDRLQIQGGALLGPSYGGYLGAAFAVLPGKFRPIVVAGMPVFNSNGARYGIRGAGGLELQINRHLSLIAEIGVEYLFNPEMDIKDTMFIPAVGASGRL